MSESQEIPDAIARRIAQWEADMGELAKAMNEAMKAFFAHGEATKASNERVLEAFTAMSGRLAEVEARLDRLERAVGTSEEAAGPN